MEESLIEAYVSRNAKYYKEKWQTGDAEKATSFGFNIAAFFLGGLWMVYRKLYIPLTILILIIVLDVSLTIFLEDNGILSPEVIAMWDRVSYFVYGGIMGAFGNHWYFQKYNKVKELAFERTDDAQQQLEYLSAKGGTNGLGVVLVLIATFALLYLIFSI